MINLYEYLDESFSKISLACSPKCFNCCTTKLWVTSLEAKYLFKGLKEEDFARFENQTFPSPKLTHNQTALLYFSGEEPPLQEEGESSPCLFLTQEGLCKIYERRPVICRILVSLKKCSSSQPAEVTEELYLMGLLALQIVENIDIGGLYGNLFELLKFFKNLKEGKIEEIPAHLLSTVEFEELPLLPEEKNLRSWVGNLYRKKIKEKVTFRDLWEEVKAKIRAQKRLTFMEDVWRGEI